MAVNKQSDAVQEESVKMLDLMPPLWTKYLPAKIGMSISTIRRLLAEENTDHPKWAEILDYIESYKQQKALNRQRTNKLKQQGTFKFAR